MIIYDDHISWSYMMIIYDDHIWWSYIIIYERPRQWPQPFCCSWWSTLFGTLPDFIFVAKHILYSVLKMQFVSCMQKIAQKKHNPLQDTQRMFPTPITHQCLTRPLMQRSERKDIRYTFVHGYSTGMMRVQRSHIFPIYVQSTSQLLVYAR